MTKDRRKPHSRFEVNQQVSLLIDDDNCRVFCELKDMSVTGARLAKVPLRTVPETFRFVIPSVDIALPCRVCWTSDSEIGVEFIGDPEVRRHLFDRGG